MGKIVTLIMCVWMLASCQESREEAMLRLVNEWNGKEIQQTWKFTCRKRIYPQSCGYRRTSCNS